MNPEKKRNGLTCITAVIKAKSSDGCQRPTSFKAAACSNSWALLGPAAAAALFLLALLFFPFGAGCWTAGVVVGRMMGAGDIADSAPFVASPLIVLKTSAEGLDVFCGDGTLATEIVPGTASTSSLSSCKVTRPLTGFVSLILLRC